MLKKHIFFSRFQNTVLTKPSNNVLNDDIQRVAQTDKTCPSAKKKKNKKTGLLFILFLCVCFLSLYFCIMCAYNYEMISIIMINKTSNKHTHVRKYNLGLSLASIFYVPPMHRFTCSLFSCCSEPLHR